MSTALVEAYRAWLEAPLWARCHNAMTWAAVAAMRADLPPAGPDPVEVEVALMFQAEDVAPFNGTGHSRLINGSRLTRGRAVRRSKRRK